MKEDEIKSKASDKTLEKKIAHMLFLKKRREKSMKRILMLLVIGNFIVSNDREAILKQQATIQKEIGAQRFATLNPGQKKRISNIISDLTEQERHHFFISFNHHYDITNKFRQQTTVNIKLSKLQYHESSRISPKDIDHVIETARNHALHY